MNRRSFLAAILASAVAGTLGTNSALAHAPAPDLEPIAETIRQYQNLVKFCRAHETEQVAGWDQPDEIRKEATAKFDQLMGYMMQEFGSCPCTKEDVRAVFKTGHPDQLTTDYLESVVRGTIPILVAMNVLSRHNERLHVRPVGMINWESFVVAYAHKIPAQHIG